MTEPGQLARDLEHLRLLSVFHYVVAGMVALFACLPLIHFTMGLALSLGWFEGGQPQAEETMVGCLIMGVAGGFVILGWTSAALIALAGRFLARRERYTYCLVVAGLECLFMPFGTVLGVFTFLVLLRDSARELFGVPAASVVGPSSPPAGG